MICAAFVEGSAVWLMRWVLVLVFGFRGVDAINSVKAAGQFEVFPLTPSGRESIQQNFEPGVDSSDTGGTDEAQ